MGSMASPHTPDKTVHRVIRALEARKELVFWALIGLTLDAVFLTVRNLPPIGDENVHLAQIGKFMEGETEILPELTVIPVYHAVVAVILKVMGASSIGEARLISFLGAALSIWIFYLLTARLCPRDRLLRTAQFCFLPILFPLLFLVYTDVWALAMILLAVERALANKVGLSAIAAGAAICLRQPNLVWAVFVWLLFFVRRESCPRYSLRAAVEWLFETWPFVVLFGIFGVFVCLNGGVAIGDRDQHEVTVNLANVWFFLLLFSLLFLPNCLGMLQWLGRKASSNALICAVILLVSLGIFWGTYHATHLYNGVSYWFFLRNRLLFWTSDGALAKAITFAPVTLGAVGFLLTPLAERSMRHLHAFAFVSILVLPLIEQRYYLVPVSLFLLLRSSVDRRWEWLQLTFYVGISAWLMYGIVSGRFFL